MLSLVARRILPFMLFGCVAAFLFGPRGNHIAAWSVFFGGLISSIFFALVYWLSQTVAEENAHIVKNAFSNIACEITEEGVGKLMPFQMVKPTVASTEQYQTWMNGIVGFYTIVTVLAVFMGVSGGFYERKVLAAQDDQDEQQMTARAPPSVQATRPAQAAQGTAKENSEGNLQAPALKGKF